jgi:hypothetical protein
MSQLKEQETLCGLDLPIVPALIGNGIGYAGQMIARPLDQAQC